MKARKETVTTPPHEESEHVVTTPPFHHREDSPANYPSKDQPEAPLGSEDGSVILPIDRTQCVPPDDPFSRFWSGQTADTSDKNKRRHRWLIRKPERRHSVDLDKLDKQDLRPYRYVLRRARYLLPQPKFHSKYPDAKCVSFEYVGFILRHIVQQWQRE